MREREPARGPVVGVELAGSGTRLVATVQAPSQGPDAAPAVPGAPPAAHRWYTHLPAPPTAEEAVEHLNALIERALRESGMAADMAPGAMPGGIAPIAVGVALAGQVDAARGVVRGVRLTNGWEDFPLAATLAARWGGPVAVLSTTQAAALAEVRVGAGRGRTNLIYLLLGRSVSAALIVDGRLVTGAHGRAGDLAHWLAPGAGPRCACGVLGHLEPVASAQSLVRAMIGQAVDHPESNAAMLAISGGRAEAMTAEQVVRLAADGDPVARAIVDRALEALAPALANLVAAFDPEALVLGGPLAVASAFLDALGQRVAALCQPFTTPPPLLGGELEPAAALTGAVVRASELAEQAKQAKPG